MDNAKEETVSSIARKFCQLFQQQMEAVVGRQFTEFSDEELEKYQARKLQLVKLRSALDRL
jgi:hypothetical protein